MKAKISNIEVTGTPAEILREGWKAYEQAVQLANSEKWAVHIKEQQALVATGKYRQLQSPVNKLPSLEDFRYWVWQSGDYARPEQVTGLVEAEPSATMDTAKKPSLTNNQE
jgi:hypothetical protein